MYSSLSRHVKLHAYCAQCNEIVNRRKHQHPLPPPNLNRQQQKDNILLHAYIPIAIPVNSLTSSVVSQLLEKRIAEEIYKPDPSLVSKILQAFSGTPPDTPEEILELYFGCWTTGLEEFPSNPSHVELLKQSVLKEFYRQHAKQQQATETFGGFVL